MKVRTLAVFFLLVCSLGLSLSILPSATADALTTSPITFEALGRGLDGRYGANGWSTDSSARATEHQEILSPLPAETASSLWAWTAATLMGGGAISLLLYGAVHCRPRRDNALNIVLAIGLCRGAEVRRSVELDSRLLKDLYRTRRPR